MALPTPTSRFLLNDSVLCDYKGLLYEAKIIQVKFDHSKGPYKIHYNGWKKTHDEWVPEGRLLPATPENLAKREKQMEQVAALKKAEEEAKERERLAKMEQTKKVFREKHTAKKSQPLVQFKTMSETPARLSPTEQQKNPAETDPKKSSAKRAKLEPAKTPRTPKDGDQRLATVEVPKQRPAEIKLPIPDHLKRQLVDDCDFITVQQKLVPLPRTPSVSTILLDYVNDCKAAGDSDPGLKDAEAVIDGLRDYFNAGLGTHLLYRFERVQYREQLDDKEMQPVNVYGAEHLLRLLVKLPTLIADADMTETQAEPITRHVTRLLKYLSDNADRLFLPAYETTTMQYVRMANPA